MKNILKIISVIIGTLIGAGFASGQEIYLFFFTYGKNGIIGLLISNVIIGIVIYKTLMCVKENEKGTYKDFLKKIFNIKKENSFIIEFINVFINLFILVTFFIMIAGFGAYFEQELGINKVIGSAILALLSCIILMKDIKAIVKVNGVIVPILISFVFLIGSMIIIKCDMAGFNNISIGKANSNFFISSILYSSYNSILLIPILLTLKKYINNKKDIVRVSIISSILMFVLSVVIFLILTQVDVDISLLEMPAVYVVTRFLKNMKLLYSVIILGSIFTTAISLGVSFLKNTSKNNRQHKTICVLICILSICVSNIGFSKLVGLLYPIFGYLGLIQIIKIGYYKNNY